MDNLEWEDIEAVVAGTIAGTAVSFVFGFGLFSLLAGAAVTLIWERPW